MQTMKLSRSDRRIDDLNHKVDELGREMHGEFRAVRSEMNTRFDSLHSQMTTMMATMIGGFVTLLAALVATQL